MFNLESLDSRIQTCHLPINRGKSHPKAKTENENSLMYKIESFFRYDIVEDPGTSVVVKKKARSSVNLNERVAYGLVYD